VIAVDALECAVPAVEALVEEREDARRGVEGQVAPEVTRSEAAPSEEKRRVERAARDDYEVRLDVERDPRFSRALAAEAASHTHRSTACNLHALDEGVGEDARPIRHGLREHRDVDAHLRAARAAEVAAPLAPAAVRVPAKGAHGDAELVGALHEEVRPAGTERVRHGLDVHGRFDGPVVWLESPGSHRGQSESRDPLVVDLLGDAKAHSPREDARAADALAGHHGHERRLSETDRGPERRLTGETTERVRRRHRCVLFGGVVTALLDDDDVTPCARELPRYDGAPRTGSDHDDVGARHEGALHRPACEDPVEHHSAACELTSGRARTQRVRSAEYPTSASSSRCSK
jgi:hypothetical protein